MRYDVCLAIDEHNDDDGGEDDDDDDDDHSIHDRTLSEIFWVPWV